MAVLNSIRGRSSVLIIVIAMALFAFIFSSLVETGVGFGSDQNVIASVNGLDIERDDFMNKVENAERQNSGSRSNIQSMDLVWDTELRRVILKNQFNKLGISVEKDQMRSILKNNLISFDEFINADGLFDESKLNDFIANLKEISPETTVLQGNPINYDSWINFESNIAQGGLESSYFNLINSGLRSTLYDGKTNFHFQNDNADIKFIHFPYSSVQDSLISVSKAELRGFIKDNPKKYSVENSRDLIYVKFDETPSKQDENEITNQLADLIIDKEEFNLDSNKTEKVLGLKNTDDHESFLNTYSEIKLYDSYVFENSFSDEMSTNIYSLSKGELYGPYKEGGYMKVTKMIDVKKLSDSVKVRHILIPYSGSLRSGDQEFRTADQSKKTADSIYNLVKRNRNKFKKLLSLSSDKVSNEKGGEIEFAYTDGFAPEFRDFSFENNVGKISVVETGFGYHIIEILSQTKKRKAVKVANLALRIESSERTIDSIFTIASKFELMASKSSFRDVATENNYSVRSINAIKDLDENIPGVGAQRSIVRWLYEDDTNKGDFKRFNLQNGGYVVVMLTAINNAGLMSNEKASITALPLVKNKKKAELIIKKISGKTLTEISNNQNKNIQTALAVNISSPTLSGVGKEPEVIGNSFGLEVGQTSKAILGNSGVFYIYLEKLNIAQDLPSYLSFSTNLSGSKTNNLNTKVYEALKDVSEVDDNRSLFY
ncbi:SurA N-terminal domain-containing protein [Flavobacteriaceae bacterium]|nr:SurA N-terminal domain-containing protein [Flavobacteriaceae bacterium]MDC1492248.1 SurA N-terminal domain-containing protein [Flavobacteriaceae bacterium]